MTDWFERLPGAVVSLVDAHLMLAVLMFSLGCLTFWLSAISWHLRKVRRRHEARNRNRRLPGSFPGDNR